MRGSRGRAAAPNERMEPVISMRDYMEPDWPGVCRVHDLARVIELSRGGVDPRAFLSMEEAAERDEFFDSETLIACDGEKVVGFISYNGAYITWMYVDPEYHRRGIARMLLREALGRIGPEAWTITLEGNFASVGVFTEAGLEVVLSGPGDCEGYACRFLRLALPTSRMHDPEAKRGGAAEGDEQP